MPNEFKKDDYVNWERGIDPTHLYVIVEFVPGRDDIIQVKSASGVDARFGNNPFLVYTRHLTLFELSKVPLYLFKVKSLRRNWKFMGYESIIVAAADAKKAATIGPSGPITDWPVEGWADDPNYIQTQKIGTAEPFIRENELVHVSYHDE